MPLRNGLPLDIFPGAPWSATAPNQIQELITTYHLEEKDFLAAPPLPQLAWADQGTFTGQGIGIVKFPHVLPSSLDFNEFKPGGAREYKTFDAVAARVKVGAAELSFGIPMVWNEIGNGWQLMSRGENDTLIDFLGVTGVGGQYAMAGKARKTQVLGSLFYKSIYCTSLSLTAPTALTYPQGLSTNGIALFSDGTGADGSTGANHYANPTVNSSPRFKNLFVSYGSFEENYGRSLVEMTKIPHATLSNQTNGARVTDTFGPTWMRDKFWRMMVQDLVLTTAEVSGNAVGAATTNPYSLAKAMGVTEENFIGASFGPRRFWIVSQLDNHPYPASSPGGNSTPDFWVNLCSEPGRATYAKLAANNKDFLPVFRFYGPGDPRAMSERLMRFEGDLDSGVAADDPSCIQMFFGV